MTKCKCKKYIAIGVKEMIIVGVLAAVASNIIMDKIRQYYG